jgi:hypothetical protein
MAKCKTKKPPMEYKVCAKCGENKPILEYSHKRPKNRKPGLQPRCKSCAKEDTRLWNIENKETQRERYLQRSYRISENEYVEMCAAFFVMNVIVD